MRIETCAFTHFGVFATFYNTMPWTGTYFNYIAYLLINQGLPRAILNAGDTICNDREKIPTLLELTLKKGLQAWSKYMSKTYVDRNMC